MRVFSETIMQLILRRTAVNSDNCWIWVGGKDKDGYGLTKFKGKTHRVHRLSFLDFYGYTTPGLVMDHLCKNKSCCNPVHLEEVTSKENVIIRGSCNPAQINFNKTECHKGHPYVGGNFSILGNGQRSCLICRREWFKIYRRKRYGTVTRHKRTSNSTI